MKRVKTAGELSKKALSDSTKYDPLELGYAVIDDVYDQLMICAEIHCPIFHDQPTFCIGLYIAGDPLLKNLKRHKYCAFPWLPEPRPNQSVFLFTKTNQSLKRLWALPNPQVMAVISTMTHVSHKWQETKAWCDAFYNKTFFETIRGRNNLSMLAQQEWLDAYGPKIGEPIVNEVKGSLADTFDFSKIAVKQVIDQNEVSGN